MSTKIEWATKTWNPTSGCSKVSPGCKNCYAIKMSNRLQHIERSRQKYDGTVNKTGGGMLNWTGRINIHFDELDTPLKWKKPERVFVGSMSDLFHPDVPFDFIDQVFDEMAFNTHHTFLVLTKRPERLVEFWEYFSKSSLLPVDKIAEEYIPNVWVGTSVENQEQANKRIPELLKIPSSIRFLSCEPLLEEIDLTKIEHDDFIVTNVLASEHNGVFKRINWVIAGGESGHNARPMNPKWIRLIRNQCLTNNTPFFFKQWGEWKPQGTIKNYSILNPKTEKVMGLDVVVRLGKSNTGRQLDGIEWNQLPIKNKS